MSQSFQNDAPKARIKLRLDLHTGSAQKKTELPLKLLMAGSFSDGREQRPVSERENIDINKSNFDSVLAEFSPSVNLGVENTLAGEGSEENISLIFRNMKDFEPEQVARIHTPFLFTKEIDSSSPYLYKAVTTGQTLRSAEFRWYKINDAGQEIEYFNTKLENVKVVKVNPVMHDIKDPAYEKHNHLEQIDLRYEKIT
ncbi:type VI secretion system contractile sheath small subunit [Salmonella enterica]|nr:type VI secretion system contractile sheath small subunit [Salmonella enterica]EAS2027924.1 type VI secretion system contractile sheath small subunit [Salmonella enterica]EAU0259663.1 type VI secretion system contractile sheath small subunit [Salmonella enterica]